MCTLLVYSKGSSTLGKLYGIKRRCYWEQSWECIWEHFENLMGTLRELGEKQKSLSPHPHQKRKNWIVHECMLSLPIGCMKFLFPKLFVTIFHLGSCRAEFCRHKTPLGNTLRTWWEHDGNKGNFLKILSPSFRNFPKAGQSWPWSRIHKVR